MADDTHSRFAKVVVVGHTTKHMTHSRSWDMEIGRPSVKDVTLGLRPRVTFSTKGSSYFHVPLTIVRHLLRVVWPTISCFADWSKRRHYLMINASRSTVCHYNDERSVRHFNLGFIIFQCPLTTVHHLYSESVHSYSGVGFVVFDDSKAPPSFQTSHDSTVSTKYDRFIQFQLVKVLTLDHK